ncbi:type IV secretion protein Rhs [Janthinobacterium sp. ROICE36]|uniref:type IV secretion protein Rhs n=1 Tax=Janthinobacterium sp. ROICE36 TaxID=2048670 RepID=UPI000C7F563E|nr:type IV secretion protein Rhs [Janthinobacterium sp. ROICE36]PLY47557.1 type IV secretion protein Rhs [Janthinobacterium sp. ROICE36]
MRVLRRPLTIGETAMARSVFHGAIDYARVRVVRGAFLPFGLQDQNTAMTPRGSLHFMPAQYRDDFSREGNSGKLFFIHEMVHVWQYQLGYCVLLHGVLLALRGGYIRQRAYRYDAQAGGILSDFNMEQQGDIIAHYFGARQLGIPAYVAKLPQLQDILQGFLLDPAERRLLPR